MPKSRETEKPWERRADESAPAFEAFSTYLNMGTERSHARVSQQLGKSKALIDRWGRRHKWQERIRAHDSFLADAETKRTVKEIKDRYTRFGRVSDQLTLKALEALTTLKASRLSPQEALALLRVAAMLADKNKGVMAPEVVDEEIENEDMLGGLLEALFMEDIDAE